MSDDYTEYTEDNSRIDSPNATYFEPSEAPDHREDHYETLWRYNQGWKTRNRVEESGQWKEDQRRLLASIADSLELTDFQRERALTVLEGVDMREASSWNQLPSEAYCVALCAFVAQKSCSGIIGNYLRRSLSDIGRSMPSRLGRHTK